jgi:predicted nucleic acid-binding protein
VRALLDVNLLLACGWRTHAEHTRAVAWLLRQPEFFTCVIVELGFIRISMGPAFKAPFASARRALADLKALASSRVVPVDFDPSKLPALASHGEVTDAYLVELARSHGLLFATTDALLLRKSWAHGVAYNPLNDAVMR